jgi:hypothetical protein
MCHPKQGDLLPRRGNRVFSRICVWSGMRASGNVLDLSGRVPGGRPGHHAARRAGAFAQGASDRYSSQVAAAARVTNREQQIAPARVQPEMAAVLSAANSDRRTGCSMEKAPTSSLQGSVRRQKTGTAVVTSVLCASGFSPSVSSLTSLVPSPASTPGVAGGKNKFTESFRRCLRNSADGDQISTGVSRALPTQGVHQTSVIVLVTPEGNVTVRAN